MVGKKEPLPITAVIKRRRDLKMNRLRGGTLERSEGIVS